MSYYVTPGYITDGYIHDKIYIDWGTRVIHIPKHELTLLQSSPIEVRELPMNWFRLQLKDLEDSIYGMVNPDTHIHNTEVSLSGLNYARVIEIINDYTITFEDGQYAVNITGANTNAQDNVNVNQVSVRASNSAGMISSPDIEFSMYVDGIVIDQSSQYSGTIHPNGTLRQPVNNINDAIIIAEYRGIKKFQALNTLSIENDDISGYIINGQNASQTKITIADNAITDNCEIHESSVSGYLDNGISLRECFITNYLYHFNGFLSNCVIDETATIHLNGGYGALMLSCSSGFADLDRLPVIDCSESGQSLAIRGYSGGLKIINKSGSERIEINISEGVIILDETVTQGYIELSGNCKFVNNTIPQDGLYIDTSGLNKPVNEEYNGKVYIDINSDTGTEYPYGLKSNPVNNIEDALIIAKEYNCSVMHCHSSLNIPFYVDISHYNFEGHRGSGDVINFESGCNTLGSNFYYLGLSGYAGGAIGVYGCKVIDLYNMVGVFDNCFFSGNCSLVDDISSFVQIKNSASFDSSIVTINVFQSKCTIFDWNGHISIQNKTGNNDININTYGGKITFEITCIDGNGYLTGIGELIDNTVNGTVVNDDLLNNNSIAHEVLDTNLETHQEHLTLGGITVKTAYDGVIEVDINNGESGISFPIGMKHHPVNNIPDMLELLERYHISTVKLNDDVDIPENTNLNGITFISGATIDRTIDIPSTCTTNGTIFKGIILNGYLDGRVEIKNCVIEEIFRFRGIIDNNSVINTGLTLDGSTGQPSHIHNSLSGGNNTPYIDVNGSKMHIVDWKGLLLLKNKTNDDLLGIYTNGGIIEVENSCIAGSIKLTGIGTVIDNSDVLCEVDYTELVNNPNITNAVWNSSQGIDTTNNINFIKDIEGGRWEIINNQMIFFKEDNLTEITRFNLLDETGNPTSSNVFQRVKQ